MIFLAEAPPVGHPTVNFCSGPAILCTFNWDSLVSSAFAILLTIAISFYIASKLNPRSPGKLQMVFELLNSYTYGLIRDTVDEDAMFILPIALTIFIYILIANWIDLLPLPKPLLHPANTDLNQTLAMAVVVIVVVQAYSLRILGPLGYLRRFTKPFDLPWPIRIFPFLFLNIVEEIAKPLTLALRLFGNLFGGLMMAYVLAVLLPQIPIPFLGTGAGTVLLAGWKLFDVLIIGTLQAFIFMLLTVIYFEQAREGLHHVPAATAAAH